MEACILVCNGRKAQMRKGKVLLIDALNEVTRERAQSFLKPEHQQHILKAYRAFADEPGFAKVATLAEIAVNAGSLSIPFYVKRVTNGISNGANSRSDTFKKNWSQWQTEGRMFWLQMDALVETLDGLLMEDVERV
jgi:type I restriction enzyme M protein